jgi:hypothetical protein
MGQTEYRPELRVHILLKNLQPKFNVDSITNKASETLQMLCTASMSKNVKDSKHLEDLGVEGRMYRK